MYCEEDWEWSPVIKRLVPAGAQVLDIGANVGYLTGLFARWTGPTGRVVAVEPIPDTYDALASSMASLFPGIVTTLSCCVSDQPGHVVMEVPVGTDGRENYYESRITSAEEKPSTGRLRFSVPATTLDNILESQHLNPGFIKIDVEGHEEVVIRGATTLLGNEKPPLLIEVSGDPDQPGASAFNLFSHLTSAGYQAYVLDGGGCRPRQPGDVAVDYLFMTPITAKKVLGVADMKG